jgi:1-aminocyclopropane-1-carboxylate deaminase/D-cysteine desulfhydrase-like pyridoxal-dependent ACC family enzyme
VDLNERRVPLGIFPTPLQRATALSELIGCDLWIKRDDLTGFSWGGNKVRAAEFLLGDAVASGADTLIVCGGPTSNFAAVMAAAASVAGLAVHHVSYGSPPAIVPAALAASVQAGALVTFTMSVDRSTMERRAEQLAVELRAAGGRPYVIPRGGGSAVGALGFAAAAIEFAAQLDALGVDPAAVVMPVGSGGSVAGFAAGSALAGGRWTTFGVSVSRGLEAVDAGIRQLSAACLGLLGSSIVPTAVALHDGRGAGFGVASPEEALLGERILRHTGLICDPVYTIKTLRWLADADLTDMADRPIVYWHTACALGAFSTM